jgi:hypothetical protein
MFVSLAAEGFQASGSYAATISQRIESHKSLGRHTRSHSRAGIGRLAPIVAG